MKAHPFDRVTEDELRRRQSAKWRTYPPDVLPAWVAEMDYPLAQPIKDQLTLALAIDDTGYAQPKGLGEAFAGWAREKWNWSIAPNDVHLAPDVVTAIVELLLVTTKAGDGVLINPPVYPPFAATISRLDRRLVEAPLCCTEDGGWRLDLDGIERAYAGGARVHVLCSPHNPVGTVHSRTELMRLAELAAHYRVLILSDEIHAPLTYADCTHLPFPTVSNDAAQTSIVLTSASKAWNLAGLKASVIVACHDETRAVVDRLPRDLPYHAGHLGVLGTRAAFEVGGECLRETMRILERNRVLVSHLLREHLPRVKYVPPQAGYLAWLDCRELGLGADPAKAFLVRGRVALSPGPSFGANGAGFARLNFATTHALLESAVRRMAAAAAV